MENAKKVSSEIEIFSADIDYQNKVVIDVGCGVGKLTKMLANQCSYVYGIDIPELIEKAKETEIPGKVEFKIGTGQNMPLENESVEIVIFSASFHHIPPAEMAKTIDESYRVLKKKGILCFIEPVAAEDSYYDITQLIDDEVKIRKLAYDVIRNLDPERFFPLKEAMSFIERSFKDFETLVNIYVADESERARVFKMAESIITAKKKNIDEIRFKSYCRLNVFEKK